MSAPQPHRNLLVRQLHARPRLFLAMGLALLVLVHVAAALKHHFVDGDGLMSRMLPGRD